MPYGDSVVWTGSNSSEDQSLKWEVTEAARKRADVAGPVDVTINSGSTPTEAAQALENAWTNANNGISVSRTGAKVTFGASLTDMLFSTDDGTSYTSLPGTGTNVNVGSTGLQVHNAS